MARGLEVERTFEAAPGTVLPDLAGVDGVAAVGEPTRTDLEDIYFDTPDLGLARRGITLRRRTGGADQGWHLTLGPPGEERTEVRLPSGDAGDAVPDALVREVRVVVRDQELAPVAIVRTSRLERHLLGQDGRDLAVLADDTVHAERLLGESVEIFTWREVTVVLLVDTPILLEAVSRRLEEEGLARSAAASPLQRVLPVEPAATGAAPEPTRKSPAGDVVVAHLREQIEVLQSYDRGVRADEPGAVRRMQVASRRLCSALRTFRPLFDRARTGPLCQDLTWLAGVLGRARDSEVIHARLVELTGAQPPELLLGPVRSRVDTEMGTRHRDARRDLLEAMDGRRYFRLLDALEELVDFPPLAPAAGRRAGRVLPKLAGRTVRRLRRDARRIRRTPPQRRERWLLEVGKDTEQVRYAAESLVSVIGKPAKRLAKAVKDAQEVLDEYRNSVGARQVLRELGVAAHLSGENGFSFGLMLGQEQARGDAAASRCPAAVKAATRKKLTRAMT